MVMNIIIFVYYPIIFPIIYTMIIWHNFVYVDEMNLSMTWYDIIGHCMMVLVMQKLK